MLVPILTFAYSRLLRFYNRYLPIVDRPLYGGLHEFLGSRYRGFCTVLVPVLEHTQGLLALKAIAASQVLGWPKRESNRIRLSTERSGIPRTPCPPMHSPTGTMASHLWLLPFCLDSTVGTWTPRIMAPEALREWAPMRVRS